MSKSLRNILIALGIIVLVVATAIIVNTLAERKLLRETTLRVESQMRFKQKVIEGLVLEKRLDTLTTVISQKQVLIDYLENNPQIIIQNNEKAHLDINKLNAFNSIVRFTDNVSRYEGLRKGRYDLHRFDKRN